MLGALCAYFDVICAREWLIEIGPHGFGEYKAVMTQNASKELRRGWTTGACATAALKAALTRLWGGARLHEVQITLPRGETPVFAIAQQGDGPGWAEAAVTKDAGDDPDVTHGALIVVRVAPGADSGVVFVAGDGVGMITKPGLPIPVGEPAINPVPRQMMEEVVSALAAQFDKMPDVVITVSVPGGRELAQKTWNPRLGIEGGLSILGTTGIVRPFSCAAWIASIHRGIDVARADGLTHVAGCTGATSEATVQTLFNLPDHAMLDMGDFAGGLLKYLARHPVERITIGGGFGKMTKLAQGAVDLHSARSQVDLLALSKLMPKGDMRTCISTSNTAMEALGHAPELGQIIAEMARDVAQSKAPDSRVDTIVIDRAGQIVGRAA